MDTLIPLLGWSALINYAILTFWWLLFFLAQDWFYQLHLKMMRMTMSKEDFQAAHYMLIGIFKVFIIVFNLVPFLVLLAIA